CFQLRDSCYRTTVSDQYVDSEEFARHDMSGRHFGLFRASAADHGVVGYVRVAEATSVEEGLPFLSHLGARDRERARTMLGALLREHERVIEAGRLSVPRSSGSTLLAKHVVECLTALYGLGLQIPAVLTCAEKHRRFYETLGFRRVLTDASLAIPWRR